MECTALLNATADITWVQLAIPHMHIATANIFLALFFLFVSGGGCIHFVFAVLRQLTDNEKMVLLQTCDQLKPH